MWASPRPGFQEFSHAFETAGNQFRPGLASPPTDFAFTPPRPSHISFDASAIADFHDSSHNLSGTAGIGRPSAPDITPRSLVVPEAGSIAIWTLIGVTLLGLLRMRRGRLD